MNKWRQFLTTWDAQQDLYRPDREHALEAISEFLAAALPGDGLRVLDLACGCGAVTARILGAVPSAQVVGLDRDPVLVRIAREIWAGDPKVTFEQADLRDGAWLDRHGVGHFDAVVTAASTHWFEPDDLSRLYRVIARSLRPGGLFANLDWIPIARAPALQRASDAYIRDRERRLFPAHEGRPSPWGEWWTQTLAEPDLAVEARERSALDLPPSAEHFADEDWHASELIAAGFAEAAVIWRSVSSAVMVATRAD
jgi:SAM-dependent methyltransferase